MGIGGKLFWAGVAGLGAVAFGIVALTRGEAVNAAWLVWLGLVRLLQSLLLLCEPLDRQKNDPFGWSVVARK